MFFTKLIHHIFLDVVLQFFQDVQMHVEVHLAYQIPHILLTQLGFTLHLLPGFRQGPGCVLVFMVIIERSRSMDLGAFVDDVVLREPSVQGGHLPP